MNEVPGSPVAAITLLLESAKELGATAKQLAEASGLPAGTVGSTVSELCRAGAVNIEAAHTRPRVYLLARFGGEKWSERVSKPKTAPTASVRIVITIGADRKSVTLVEAKQLYADLKEIFR